MENIKPAVMKLFDSLKVDHPSFTAILQDQQNGGVAACTVFSMGFFRSGLEFINVAVEL